MSVLEYRLELEETADATGYFSIRPVGIEGVDNLVATLEERPMDTFLRLHTLKALGALDQEKLKALASEGSAFEKELVFELAVTFDELSSLRGEMEANGFSPAQVNSPMTAVRFIEENGFREHPWAEMIRDNHHSLKTLPHAADVTPLPEEPAPMGPSEPLPVADMAREIAAQYPSEERMRAADTGSIAKMKLEALGIFTCGELRHQASLSPIGLMRKWKLDRTIESGPVSYHLTGEQTSYGKGLSVADARASLYMEIAERHSSFASIVDGKIEGTAAEQEVVKARFSELQAKGENTLDPNALMIDVTYRDEPLHWMQGEQKVGGEYQPIWVPVQAVFLFMNLDEPALFTSLGSTGLASGNTPDEARLSGLYEALEREAEATQPFDPSMCFQLYTANENLGPLLSAYRQGKVNLFFQEMTGRLGVPCCKAMVMNEEGVVEKGCAVNLDARRAAVSSMVEVPHQFPEGEATQPPPGTPVAVHEEQLPSYATGSAKGDVALVERVLSEEGFSPIYVDLTRKDLEIPVAKALVPGFAISADVDAFTRLSPRLISCAWAMMKARHCGE